MKAISAYLNFQGNTEVVFNFYKSVFGGEFAALQRFKDMPDMPGGMKVDDKDKDKILHISLSVGKGVTIMGSDALESHGQKLVFGNNAYLMIDAESEEEAGRIFKDLSSGGKVEMPLQKMFWGALYASFTDKYGVQWMINYSFEQRPLDSGF